MKLTRLAAFAALSFSVEAASVRVVGSDSIIVLASSWAEAFGAPVEVSGGGSGIGVAALINGSADIATVARPLDESENQELTKRFGAAPVVTKVAYDALAVFVHKDNPVSKITIGELREIYIAGGKIDNWSQLGGKAPSKIAPLVRHSNSGALVYFREAVLGKRAEFKEGMRGFSTGADIVLLIEVTPTAIGFALPSNQRDGVKPLALSAAPDRESVIPTGKTIRDGTYPISRPLYFVSSPKASAETKKFIEFVLSKEGQSFAEKQGYTPLGDALEISRKQKPH